MFEQVALLCHEGTLWGNKFEPKILTFEMKAPVRSISQKPCICFLPSSSHLYVCQPLSLQGAFRTLDRARRVGDKPEVFSGIVSFRYYLI